MAELTYYGHSAWAITSSAARLLIDPWLNGNPHARHTADDVQADWILVSHGHSDHLGDTIPIAKRTGAKVIAPYELALYCQAQGCQVHPMHIGGTHDFPFGRVRMTVAHQGSAVVVGDGPPIYTGNPCGFCVTIEGVTIYYAGDTGVTPEMELLGKLESIDMALLPIGGNFTMDIADAVVATELLGAQMSIPMHYNTFPVIQADPEAFVAQVLAKGRKARVVKPGESITLGLY